MLHTDSALTIIGYLAFSAFTIIRVYAVWRCNWKPLVIVVPLALVRPAVFTVRNLKFLQGALNTDGSIIVRFQYQETLYYPLQAGPPTGCVGIWFDNVSDERILM